MKPVEPAAARLALSEVVASLSLATDLGMGQPMEHGLRTCLLALGLAEALGLDGDQQADTYYLSLLRWIGCTAHAHELSDMFGDETLTHARAATMDFGRPLEVLVDLLRHAGEGRALLERGRVVGEALRAGPRGTHDLFAASCEVATSLASRLDVRPPVRQALAFVFARWDGRGFPEARGADIPLCARVMHVAQDAAVFHRMGGVEAAVAVVRRRAGHAYDPHVADAFLSDPRSRLEATERESLWEAVIDAEPVAPLVLDAARIDSALMAVADFADLKSPFTTGHSRAVADLAAAASAEAGLDRDDVVLARRSGLVHDVGRTGVPNDVWDRTGPLSDGQWERVRMHPYLTERILARSPALRPIGAVAALHHERLDGSGYHRGARAASLSPVARILAAADAYQGMTADRPHRVGLMPEEAAERLRSDVRDGRLDGDAVRAVLVAAGHRLGRRRTEWPAGLTSREAEVLRLVARGLSTRAIADVLTISPKSVDHHVQHIYDKIGVRSRAGAALFAVQHDLVEG